MSAEPDSIEDVIAPDAPVIDPHHHLWGPEKGYTPATYLLDELAADIGSGHNVVATVYVEAGAGYRPDGPERLQPVGETEAAVAAAQDAAARGISTRVAASIVAHADLSLGAGVAEVLEAHRAAAPERFHGIRDMVSPEWITMDFTDHERRLVQPGFREGLATLAEHDLSFDVYAFQTQLPDVLDTVRAFPDVTFVVNHLGGIVAIGPWQGKRDEMWPAWQADVSALGREPNVVMKLGGINMHLAGFAWHKQRRLPSSDQLVAATGRYYHHAIEAFSPDRCMFESNFPPDKISGSYRTLWNAFKKIASKYSDSEQDALLRGTAARVYRIS